MKKLAFLAVVAVAAATLPGAAFAGVYGDDLARCLVKAATPTDRTVLMQWMFAAVSTSPAFRPMVTLSDADREGYDKQVAALLERLVLQDCHAQTVTALKNEGPEAINAGFETLGQVAGRSMMSTPETAAELAKVGKFVDTSKFTALAAEAGLAAPGQPAAKK
jgi:hypothetical protein